MSDAEDVVMEARLLFDETDDAIQLGITSGQQAEGRICYLTSSAINRSITLTMNLTNNRFNHKHCHVSYCQQIPVVKFLLLYFVNIYRI